MEFVSIPDLDVRRTLDSGQFFRWEEGASGFAVYDGEVRAHVRPVPGGILLDGAPSGWALRFFSADHDYTSIRRHPWIAPLARRVPGLRLLRTDPWETTLTFLLSICSNQPRIRRTLFVFAERFGRDGMLPRPEEIPTERRLRSAGAGFRAPYIAAAARRAEMLCRIAAWDTAHAREILMEWPGISHKVADCILLFGFGRTEVFPVDVWIRRAVRACALGPTATDRAIREWAYRAFGRWAGYAQQVMYVTARSAGAGRESPRSPSPRRRGGSASGSAIRLRAPLGGR
jgi:N-glycosylase/DNA lyase